MRLASNGEIVAAKKSPVQSSVSLNRGSRNLASQLSWQKEVFFRKKRKGQSVFLLLGMAIALFVKLNKAQGRSSQLFSAHKSLEYHFAKLSLFARIAHFLKFFSTGNGVGPNRLRFILPFSNKVLSVVVQKNDLRDRLEMMVASGGSDFTDWTRLSEIHHSVFLLLR